jgi:hypothetical protein
MTAIKKANPEKMEADSAELEAVAVHRRVPVEDVILKPVGGRKKRHGGRHVAAGRRGEPKELTRGDCGSRRKLTAACRMVSRRARVAWDRRNIVREYIKAKVERGIRRVRALRERVRTRHEGRKGIKDLGGERPRYLRK